jgi:O-antigen/teichoic acid export membrane protein
MKRHIFWSGVEAAGGALLSVISAFAIARLIGPTELGVGAAAAAVHVLLWVAVNALFADALVQRAGVDDTVASSAFWASVGAGVLAMPVQIGSGWVLAGVLHDERLVPMALLLALPLPLVGAGGAMQGVLTRGRGYRALAARTIVGQGAGAAVGVVLASNDAGAWAPVVQLAVSSFAGAATLLATAGWRPRLVFSAHAVRALLTVGLPLTASTLVQLGRYRLFAILIGGTAGASALGQVHVAFRLVDTVRELAFTALWRLMLPILSEQQHDRSALLATVDRLLRLSSRLLLPLCAVLAVSLVPVVPVILGPGWAAAGQAAMPLVGLMALLGLMFPSGVALVAAGGARQALYANLAGLVATSALVLIARPADPWHAVLVWCGGQLFVSPYAMWMNGKVLGVGPFRPLRAGLAWLVPSLALAWIAIASGV